ncbi:helix-turn-helix domain-containing protein [Monoglobus pectinilyticus]|uniref:Helix-turn-helix domain protein n=1 Tax=Monoglobus pectinilyticus TaxID=1981510 RepID=A0A2K9P3Q5_9FIRM|nr:helix-turn-helix transcriptional regulator [Monoglobus pectinilyticus]AUO19893.1 helix-turn-helix domain protein [Monoglobus pectinilyticus]
MNLSDRIKIIISENSLKQKEFAKSINVTESYISKLLRGESGVSNSTATLIEELYGYSIDWILNGSEPKFSKKNNTKDFTPIQRKIISDIEQMDESDLIAVKAFIKSLDAYKRSFDKNEQ